MTRPVFEPTPTRWTASLDYGVQQLFRRPAPRTGGGMAVPYAVMECTDVISIPNDTYTVLDADITGSEWTDGYINPEGLAMTPQPFDFDFHNGLITWRSSGLFIGQLQINWCATFPVSHTPILIDFIYFGNCAVASNCGSFMSSHIIPNNESEWQHGYYVSQGQWVSEADPDVDSSVKGAVAQISGTGSKDICGAALIVAKIADFDPDTGEFLPLVS